MVKIYCWWGTGALRTFISYKDSTKSTLKIALKVTKNSLLQHDIIYEFKKEITLPAPT
jgi:hypothetical protein